MTAIVSTDWLAAHLEDPWVKVLDGSWYLPAENRDPLAEHKAAHIAGAQFFDLSKIKDQSSALPHMFPPAHDFRNAVRALGINQEDLVVIYDGAGVFSSPRVWWMFRAMGHQNVFVLDGGFPKWTDETRPVTAQTSKVAPGNFEAEVCPYLIKDWRQVKSGRAQIVDARAHERFLGSSPEPRPGLRAGHIPGAINVPYKTLLTENGVLKSAVDLRTTLLLAGVDLSQPITTSCGSGVTASVLALALYQIGVPDVAVYDGSWAEWGGRMDLPITASA